MTVIGDHQLRLLFEDGTVGDIAFDEDEWRGVFAPLRDPAVFAQVRVDVQAGTIVWPGDLNLTGLCPSPTRCTAWLVAVAAG